MTIGFSKRGDQTGLEYVYSRHSTADRAAWSLEDYFATDIVSEAERPTYRNEPRYKGDPRPWAVIFIDWS